MALNYYLFDLMHSIRQSILLFKLRKFNKIGKKCSISKNVFLEKNVTLYNNVVLGEKTYLKRNVIIGNNVKLNNIEIGENTQVDSGVICTGFGEGKIIIGKESYIGINNVLDWSDSISIGNYVHIAGPSTGLWTHSSAGQCFVGLKLSDKNKKYRPTAPTTIEDNVYIGGNCTVYPGVIIGHHSIIAPNSAVTKNVQPYTMVGGVPAKFIKKLEKDFIDEK